MRVRRTNAWSGQQEMLRTIRQVSAYLQERRRCDRSDSRCARATGDQLAVMRKMRGSTVGFSAARVGFSVGGISRQRC